ATKSGATITTGYTTPKDASTIGGYIKIEIGRSDGSYVDITQKILSSGFADKDQPSAAGIASVCSDPTPNAIIRLQRLRNTNTPSPVPAGTACSVTDLNNLYEYWPNTLFDSREGVQRDIDPGTFSAVSYGVAVAAGTTALNSGLQIGGVTYYVA